MDRRTFLMTNGALTAAALLPATLLAEGAEKANEKKFPRSLAPRMDGNVKEFKLYIDIYQQEIVPSMKLHTLAFNNPMPGPEIRIQKGDNVRVIFKNKTDLNHTIH